MKAAPVALAALLALAVASPAHAITCPILSDPVGDGRSKLVPVVESPQIDIVSGNIASGSTTVAGTLRVASLAPDTVSAMHPRWALSFALGATTHTFGAEIPLGTGGTPVGSFDGLPLPAGSTFTINVTTSTFRWSVPRSAVPELVWDQTFHSVTASTSVLVSNADAAGTQAVYLDQTPGCISAS
jgi:hypothetical protein